MPTSVPTNALIGFGITLQRGDGADPEVFSDVAQIVSLNPPQYTADAIDATHSHSPNAHREFIAGLIDAGEVSGEIHFVPTTSAPFVGSDMLTDMKARVLRSYRIVFPGEEVQVTFGAIVTAFQPQAPFDGKMTASYSMKISGEPVWAAV